MRRAAALVLSCSFVNSELPPPALPPSAEKSNLPTIALVLSLFACCPLVGIVAFILGFVSMRSAVAAGRPRPTLSIVAMILSALFMLFGIIALIFGIKENAEREEAAEAMKAKLSGKLDAQTLDQQTACDLANLYFLDVKEESADEFKCEGPFENADVPRLLNVKRKYAGEDQSFTFCFARAHRWYVVATPSDERCPVDVPPPPSTKPADEEAFKAQEQQLREDAAEARAVTLIAQFSDTVLTLRDSLDTPHVERKCTLPSETKASYVDAERILGGAEGGDPGWKMLTDPHWRVALDDKGSAVERAEAIDEVRRKGKLVVIFDADEARAWPLAETGGGYVMGGFDGWLTVVSLSDGEVVCDGKLLFESSDTVGGGIKLKGMPDKSTKDLIEDDFEDKFKDAATAKVKAMSGDKLKLGLKFLE